MFNRQERRALLARNRSWTCSETEESSLHLSVQAMNEAQSIQQFVEYVRTLKGDEKGEAQVFCDRLFQAFGHAGYKEAGGICQ
jgi:hypothetical protein